MAVRQIVVFGLNNEEYGIEITEVQEIVRYQDITKLPETLDFIKGVINLRGKVIPVIDLKYKFYKQNSSINDETRIMVIRVDDSVLGIIADNVSEVLSIPEGDIERTDIFMGNLGGVRGIGKLEGRLLLLLDIKQTLSDEELRHIEKVS